MNVKIDKSFDKDIDNIRDKHLLKKLQNVIAIRVLLKTSIFSANVAYSLRSLR